MKNNIKRFTTSLLILFSLTGLSPLPALASFSSSQASTDVCQGVGTVSGSSGCSATSADSSVSSIIALILNILSIVVGVAAVIMIIIGGIKFITSGGESANVSSAKNTIIFAIVGLVIVALAQIIVHFVLNEVHSSTGT